MSLVHQALQNLFRWRMQRRIGRLNRHENVAIDGLTQLDPLASIDLWSPRDRVEIGRNVEICRGALLATFGGSICLGDNVYVGPYTVLYGHGGLTIGADTLIAAHAVIVPANHSFSSRQRPIREQREQRLGITIGEDVWIGAGAKILDGVTIGRGSIIGAGAVVNRSVPDFAIAVGVPARVIGTRGLSSAAAELDLLVTQP